MPCLELGALNLVIGALDLAEIPYQDEIAGPRRDKQPLAAKPIRQIGTGPALEETLKRGGKLGRTRGPKLISQIPVLRVHLQHVAAGLRNQLGKLRPLLVAHRITRHRDRAGGRRRLGGSDRTRSRHPGSSLGLRRHDRCGDIRHTVRKTRHRATHARRRWRRDRASLRRDRAIGLDAEARRARGLLGGGFLCLRLSGARQCD